MTKNQIIAQLKQENPILSYGINDEVVEMTSEQYEATIESWAVARVAKAQAKAQAEAKKATAEGKLTALGLDADDLKALGLG